MATNLAAIILSSILYNSWSNLKDDKIEKNAEEMKLNLLISMVVILTCLLLLNFPKNKILYRASGDVKHKMVSNKQQAKMVNAPEGFNKVFFLKCLFNGRK